VSFSLSNIENIYPISCARRLATKVARSFFGRGHDPRRFSLCALAPVLEATIGLDVRQGVARRRDAGSEQKFSSRRKAGFLPRGLLTVANNEAFFGQI